jgi:hypothetical protein
VIFSDQSNRRTHVRRLNQDDERQVRTKTWHSFLSLQKPAYRFRCFFSLELGRVKTNQRPSSGALAICARPSEKTPAPARRNTASGSGGGICLRTALSKDSVGVGHLRTLTGGSSALARGKTGDQPEHGQFYYPYHFLSHDRRGGPLDWFSIESGTLLCLFRDVKREQTISLPELETRMWIERYTKGFEQNIYA